MVALVPTSTANGSAPLVILLVEDEVVVRWSIAEALREAGYTVVEAGSGEQAIAICASDVSVDLLFTDINLLGLATGWDVAESFRAHHPEVSVLYTSGERINSERCVGRSEFLAKPYHPGNAVSACQRLCKKDR
jgi:CheY-like chemotaxis protein